MYAQRVKMGGAFGLRACVCVSISNCNYIIAFIYIWLEKVTGCRIYFHVPSFLFYLYFFFCRRFPHELTSQNVPMLMLNKKQTHFYLPICFPLLFGEIVFFFVHHGREKDTKNK
jgi:hypothetical protein